MSNFENPLPAALRDMIRIFKRNLQSVTWDDIKSVFSEIRMNSEASSNETPNYVIPTNATLAKFTKKRQALSRHYQEIVLNYVLLYCKGNPDQRNISNIEKELHIHKLITAFLSYACLSSIFTVLLECQAFCLAFKELKHDENVIIQKEIDDELIEVLDCMVENNKMEEYCKFVENIVKKHVTSNSSTTVTPMAQFKELLFKILHDVFRYEIYEKIEDAFEKSKKISRYGSRRFVDLKKFVIRIFRKWNRMGISKSAASDFLSVLIPFCFEGEKLIEPLLDTKIIHCVFNLQDVHNSSEFQKKVRVAFDPLYDFSFVSLENDPQLN
uniref:MIF4G domain-containing protein n=1 Tax=Rhabditophanes sp. KR3021 TaxID=114890 RepID=A0AC35UDH7_9BILA